MMLTRSGYSRWALLAGLATALFAINCLLLFTGDFSSFFRWVHQAYPAPITNLVIGAFHASAMGWAPLSLFLSSLACRQLRRNPDLRGKWIARIAVVVGTLGTAGFVFVIVVTMWNP